MTSSMEARLDSIPQLSRTTGRTSWESRLVQMGHVAYMEVDWGVDWGGEVD